jgi:uncharacterized protein DUF4189
VRSWRSLGISIAFRRNNRAHTERHRRMRFNVVVGLGVFAYATSFLPAHADCLSDCLGSQCSGVNYGEGIYCKLRSNDCLNQCRNSGGGSQGAAWGAIAYSLSTGDYGYSEGYSARSEAERWAIKECGKNDCKVAAWFSNSCGAVATGDNEAYGGAQHNNEKRARELALSRCEKEGGRNCEVIFSHCSP